MQSWDFCIFPVFHVILSMFGAQFFGYLRKTLTYCIQLVEFLLSFTMCPYPAIDVSLQACVSVIITANSGHFNFWCNLRFPVQNAHVI